ncbi:MAG: adenosylmethionine decarboxylase [Aigarchaeota archaeon]|nr:adenosylmethionine decarboxylase [Aigarchaeota archaeon]MCX8192591.1 adenosylmethionine decarboxylase [Nitrososphaeria archaeon]MDW7985673.1 adenosylmethionine decarboxylase [Nitrososphaerota archaeon]
MKTLGRHLVVEMYGCRSDLLGDLSLARKSLNEAVEACKATFMGEHYTMFPGGGVSGVIIIAESHISIHTWPEHGYIAIDIFTCGEHIDPWKAYEVFVKNYSPSRVNVMEIRRGVVEV